MAYLKHQQVNINSMILSKNRVYWFRTQLKVENLQQTTFQSMHHIIISNHNQPKNISIPKPQALKKDLNNVA